MFPKLTWRFFCCVFALLVGSQWLAAQNPVYTPGEYPAPRYPQIKASYTVDDLMPIAREVVRRPVMSAFLKAGYAIQPGQRALIVVPGDFEPLVLDAIVRAIHEAGGEADVVRTIYGLYLDQDLGVRSIARDLNERGFRTRRGESWSMVTVRDILRNRAYVGTYSRFGVRVPASHAPLISQEDFRRVQERLDQRRPSSTQRQVSPFLLSGITLCGYCGNKMIGVTRKQKWRRADGSEKTAQYRYYQCESRTNRSLCDYHTRRAEVLEEEVSESLRAASLSDAANGTGSKADLQAQMTRLRDKIRRLDKRLEGYLDSAAAGQINPEKAQAMAQAIAVEQLEIEDRLVATPRIAEQYESEGELRRHREEVVNSLRTEWQSMEFTVKQEHLREVVDRITVRDDGVELTFKS